MISTQRPTTMLGFDQSVNDGTSYTSYESTFTPHTQRFQSLDSDNSPFTTHFDAVSWDTPTCPEIIMMDVISPRTHSEQDAFPPSALPTTPLFDQPKIPSPSSTTHPPADDPYWVQLYEAMCAQGSLPFELDEDGMIASINLPDEISSQFMDELMKREEDFLVEGDAHWDCRFSFEDDADNLVIEIGDMSEIYESILACEFSDTAHT